MKKKLAALLCGVMCMTGFTGCSDTELAYLKMSGDLIDAMSSCKISGEMKADVDLDALQDFIVDVAEAANSGVAVFGQEEMSGKKSVKLGYDMQMDLNTLEYVMGFDLSYEGKKYDLGDLYYSLTEGMYYSTDGVWGMYEMAADLTGEAYADSYFFSDAYAADLKAALAEEPYIELVSVEDLTGMNMDEALPENGFEELYDAVFTFYEDLFEGFETGMVKEIPGGFAIEADGHAVAQLFVDFMDFMAANPDQVLDAAEAYLTAVMDEMPGEEAAAIPEMFAAARESKDEFVAAVDGINAVVKTVMEEESVQMVLDSFGYEAVVKKEGAGFVSQESYLVAHEGKTVCSIASESVMKATVTQMKFPAGGMTADELGMKLEELNDTYNPVIGAAVSWGWEDTETEALLYTIRAEELPLAMSEGAEWTGMAVQNGRAYVPLRAICDILGEDVIWDQAAKKAYVRVDGVKTELAGILQDGTSYVGVREFEKMGYTVEYSSIDGEKEALILK